MNDEAKLNDYLNSDFTNDTHLIIPYWEIMTVQIW